MKKVIDFKKAKKRIVSKRKKKRRKEISYKSLIVGVGVLFLFFSFFTTYKLVMEGNMSFLTMKIGMGAF